MGEGIGFEQPEIVENKGVVDELEHVLEGTPPGESYLPDRELQISILRELPDNLVEELHGHLIAMEKKQQQVAKGGGEARVVDESSEVRGELFERLAALQYGKPGAEVQDPRLAEGLSQELVNLMHDPERFSLSKQLGHIRNPDLAFFRINDQGKIEIEAAGEAKLGFLNYRSSVQIGRGFREGTQKMVRMVNRLDKPEEFGLSAVAQSRVRGGYLEVAGDLKVKIIVPANRNLENKASLVNRNDFPQEEDYTRFLELLQDESRIEVLKSAFSRQEVATMAYYLLGKIRERYTARL